MRRFRSSRRCLLVGAIWRRFKLPSMSLRPPESLSVSNVKDFRPLAAEWLAQGWTHSVHGGFDLDADDVTMGSLTTLDTAAYELEVVTAIDTAVDAFRATLLERGALVGAGATDAAAVGRRAALLVEGATAWADHVGPLLDVRATMEIVGVTTRQAVYDLVARRRLLGLPRGGGGMAFPAFQFDPTTGRPCGVLPGLLAVFAAGDVDAYTVASWLATVQDELDGRCPASLLDDPATARALRLAAERASARLGH